MGRRLEGERGHRQARAWALVIVALLLLVAVPAPASMLPDVEDLVCENPLPRDFPVCEAWVTISARDSVGRAEPQDSVMSADGSTVYAVGDVTLPGTGWDLLVVAYDVDTGAERWTYRFDGGNGGTDRGYAITEDPWTGDLFVAGETNPAGNDRDMLLVSLTKDGVERWVWTWTHGEATEDLARSITLDLVTRTVVVQGMVVEQGLATLHGRDASTGAPLWEVVRKGEGDLPQVPRGVVDLPGPYFADLLRMQGEDSLFDLVLSARNAATGEERWSLTGDIVPKNMAVSADGGTLFVTGANFGHMTTIAWNATTGQEIWDASSDSSFESAVPEAVAVSADGTRVFVAGRNGPKLLVLAHAAENGATLWVEGYEDPWKGQRPTIPGATASQQSVATAARMSVSGDTLIVAGSSEAWDSPLQADRDLLILGYDASSGDQKWSMRFNGPGWDWDRATGPGGLTRHPTADRFIVVGVSERADPEDSDSWVALGFGEPGSAH